MKKIITYAFNIIVVIIGLALSSNYVWLTAQGKIIPTLATWVLFWIAATLSFRTYWLSNKKHSIIGNVANFVDLIFVWVILFGILIFGRNINFRFNVFEVGCLVASLAILVFWIISKKHFTSNILLQIIMTIAYLPTLHSLWFATKNVESFSVWGVWFIGGIIALGMAVFKKDTLGIVYAARALLLEGAIILFMFRIA